MPLSTRHIFVDESGTPSLEVNKDGVQPLYVVSAVIVEGNSVGQVWNQAEEIRKKHFQSGEMKSSGIKFKKGNRYERILTDISDLDFKCCSIVVDKSALESKGYEFDSVFYKNINRRLYDNVLAAPAPMIIHADERGHKEFMDEFEHYLQKYHPKTDPMFSEKYDFNFSASEQNPLIQVADLVSGLVARYCMGKIGEEIFNILKNKFLDIEQFPTRRVPFTGMPDNDSSPTLNRLIRDYAESQILRFLRKTEKSQNKELKAQRAALEFLYFQFWNDFERFFCTAEILEELRKDGFHWVNENNFRSKIITPLRDNGVIIVSCPAGYKIPFSSHDVDEYVNFIEGQTVPMLRRFQELRKQFLVASLNGYDILGSEHYKLLKAFLLKLEEFDDFLKTAENNDRPLGL